MLDKNFINTNRDFWSKFKELDTNDTLLVETSDHPVINHANAVMAKMVARAKHLRIAWLKDKIADEDMMLSYSTDSIFLEYSKINLFIKSWFLISSIFYYLFYVAIINRLLSFRYKGIPYGDFIYDGYLSDCSMATLHRFDLRIIKIFNFTLSQDWKARLILKKNPIKAVLVSHYIGLIIGPLSRVAMQANIPVYWKGGGHEVINLSVFNSLSQIYDYPKKPSNETIDLLVRMHREAVDVDFKEFINNVDNPFYGALSVAYNNVIFSDVTRESFLKTMNLDNKPIIFIMLHAFNDQPHSHFKKMLFGDYCDWFIKTFRFARKDMSKNWIFKEHPANKFYKTKDLNLNKMMKNLPNHIRFVSQDSDVKASTVLNVSDMIITCMGTAGVEMPALKGIPAVVAGNTFYDGFGFTIEPKSKKEYFEILKEIKPGVLLPEQQQRARCCYMYLNKYCMMPFAAGPAVTFKEASTNLDELKISYPERIIDAYKINKDIIYNQFNEYVSEIRKEDFKQLAKLPK